LQTGLTAGAGLALATSWAGAAAVDTRPLITRAIPGSGEKLPAVGLGTDKFRSTDHDAIQAEIGRMQQMGGTVIDTAAAYGDSEALIGESLAALGIRAKMFVATKLTASGAGYGGDGVGGKASFERSLARLKTERVDLLQIHNLDGVDALLPVLREWKQAGRIRYVGITTSRVSQHAQMVEFMRKYPLDFVQVDYSLANRDAASTVLPLALERRVAVLANIPFGFGAVLRQAQTRKLPDWAADIDATTWGQFLLKYVISHPAVTCAIPGSTQVAHLEDNQQAARGRLPDDAMRRKMEQFWDAA
jgi:aryl-alcohol dehydrogenase-like predicted oxidoreductase